MTKKPSIVLHPGLPKCATSSIQRMFYLDDFAVGKALGVKVIGRDFQVYNGTTDVSKFMYEPEKVLGEIEGSSHPPDQTYFLSNEALQDRKEIVSVLARRFNIMRTIVTVRFLPLQGISNFCYSSWLYSGFLELVNNPARSPFTTITRFRPKIEYFKKFSDEVLVCPTEGLGLSLEKRFLKMAFDRVPDVLNQPPFTNKVRTNTSICPAFAEALALEIADRNLSIPGPARNKLVRGAQSYALPEDLSALTIPAIANMKMADFDSSLAGYLQLLVDFGLSAEDLEAVEIVVRRNVDALLATEAATDAQMNALRDHARALLADAN